VSHGLAFRLRRRSRAALRRNARPYAFAGVVALRSSLTLPRFPVLLLGTEAARGFLLELGYAKVTFGMVVVAGNAQVGEEAQDLVAALA